MGGEVKLVKFLLACEGPSDAGLVPHIERLIAEVGEIETEGEVWFYGRRLPHKIRNGLEAADGMVDLLFVHRDANSAGAQARFDEIENAARAVADAPRWVGVVPVRMTEAWLILDEAAIRAAVGRPNGRTPLHLPTTNEVERRANPKEILASALLAASEASGRRRKEIKRDFGTLRQRLLRNLPIDGPVTQLDSWARFRNDTLQAMGAGQT